MKRQYSKVLRGRLPYEFNLSIGLKCRKPNIMWFSAFLFSNRSVLTIFYGWSNGKNNAMMKGVCDS